MDAQPDHSMLHMQLDHGSLHVYSLVGGLDPGSSGWLILLVFLWSCKPFQLLHGSSLSPPLETPYSVQWLDESINLCICQALAEPLRRQLYQAPVSMYFLASTIVSEFGVGIWDGSQDGAISAWPFLQSLLYTLSLYCLSYFVIPPKKD